MFKLTLSVFQDQGIFKQPQWTARALLTVKNPQTGTKQGSTIVDEFEECFSGKARSEAFFKAMEWVVRHVKETDDAVQHGRAAPVTTKAARWIGTPPGRCDVCEKVLPTARFVDGLTTLGGWAIMCDNCHPVTGKGLGTGLGQQYTYEAKSGHWVKTAG